MTAAAASRQGCVALPDGRCLEFQIRPSLRSKSVRLTLSARNGLVVVVPSGLPTRKVVALVSTRADWIAHKLADFDEVRHLLAQPTAARPEAFDLPALAESWRVEYRATLARTVGARTEQSGRVLVSGAIDDGRACRGALRRWLAGRAKEMLIPWLDRLSQESGLRYADAAIKSQRTRWGSCSAQRRISLNSKLLFLPRELVRYVLVHELCHTMEPNHTQRFWAFVRQNEPCTDALHADIRDAWKFVPQWARTGQKATL
jgi:predicted metal-dependent hydrolase